MGMVDTSEIQAGKMGKKPEQAMRVAYSNSGPVVVSASVVTQHMWVSVYSSGGPNRWNTTLLASAKDFSSSFEVGENGFGSAIAISPSYTCIAMLGSVYTNKYGNETSPLLTVWVKKEGGGGGGGGSNYTYSIAHQQQLGEACKSSFPCFALSFADEATLIASVVGNPLLVYSSVGGAGWGVVQHLSVADASPTFGSSLASSWYGVVVGDPSYDDESGRVSLFLRNTTFTHAGVPTSTHTVIDTPACSYNGGVETGMGASSVMDFAYGNDTIMFATSAPSSNVVLAVLVNRSNAAAAMSGGIGPEVEKLAACGELSLIVPEDYNLASGAGVGLALGGQRLYFSGPGVFFDSRPRVYESAFCYPGQAVRDSDPFDYLNFRTCGTCSW
mmetsp:Transcript_20974/g.54175  ORF Transcript_20974/g.54175 Transcript_20974/m.54175 type:complete len:386 (-) Transcript_20974:20-1177(-)